MVVGLQDARAELLSFVRIACALSAEPSLQLHLKSFPLEFIKYQSPLPFFMEDSEDFLQ